jgi:hypothetical protein
MYLNFLIYQSNDQCHSLFLLYGQIIHLFSVCVIEHTTPTKSARKKHEVNVDTFCYIFFVRHAVRNIIFTYLGTFGSIFFKCRQKLAKNELVVWKSSKFHFSDFSGFLFFKLYWCWFNLI